MVEYKTKICPILNDKQEVAINMIDTTTLEDTVKKYSEGRLVHCNVSEERKCNFECLRL